MTPSRDTMPDASPDALEWHARFVDALCAHDAGAYLSFLAPDCEIHINNALPIYSKAAIERAYEDYLQLFRSLTVDVLTIHGSAQSLSVEALLNYVRNDGEHEVVQCAYFIGRDDAGLISAIRVYGNAARVFKPFIPATE
jgi:hypothetical protein